MTGPLVVPASPRIVRGVGRVMNHRVTDGSREGAKTKTGGGAQHASVDACSTLAGASGNSRRRDRPYSSCPGRRDG